MEKAATLMVYGKRYDFSVFFLMIILKIFLNELYAQRGA